jgi:hypothetical protein
MIVIAEVLEINLLKNMFLLHNKLINLIPISAQLMNSHFPSLSRVKKTVVDAFAPLRLRFNIPVW